MPQVVKLPLDSGDVVLVEVADVDGAGLDRVGRTAAVAHATSETLQDALRRTQSAIEAVVKQMRGLVEPPDKITLKFGIKVTAAAGVVVAKASSEANFELSVEWVKPPVA
ncbi:Hypothetical protein AJAP_07030 [Amycolatopsis japonica]|uniref:Trypsin-co-occurring domain-containing protein n=1 Tax=Amycolatopsis japonica TaxID=208439 RepID=A0A075UN63_9PSEU|nr:CU044_2847 family protein [Amycolatopsis japonica]AIG74323.1 Hypothetical protein AJAP_07030 [Amycolatopsis japonica]